MDRMRYIGIVGRSINSLWTPFNACGLYISVGARHEIMIPK